MDAALRRTPPAALPESVAIAGLLRRLFARVIDALLTLITLVAVFFGVLLPSDSETAALPALVTVLFVAAVGIPAVETFCVSRFGATPGKKIVGIRVVATSGERPGPRRSLLRSVAVFGPYMVFPLLMFVPLAWIAFEPHRRGLHDLLAGTVVVRAG